MPFENANVTTSQQRVHPFPRRGGGEEKRGNFRDPLGGDRSDHNVGCNCNDGTEINKQTNQPINNQQLLIWIYLGPHNFLLGRARRRGKKEGKEINANKTRSLAAFNNKEQALALFNVTDDITLRESDVRKRGMMGELLSTHSFNHYRWCWFITIVTTSFTLGA